MKPLGLSRRRLARDLHVPVSRINQIVRGACPVRADMAMRLGRYFGTSAEMWLNVQVDYDLEVAEAKLAKRIAREVKVLQPAPPPA